MTVYNVAIQVVELIDTDSPENALAELRKRLRQAGFEVMDLEGDAFESEDQEDCDCEHSEECRNSGEGYVGDDEMVRRYGERII